VFEPFVLGLVESLLDPPHPSATTTMRINEKRERMMDLRGQHSEDSILKCIAQAPRVNRHAPTKTIAHASRAVLFDSPRRNSGIARATRFLGRQSCAHGISI